MSHVATEAEADALWQRINSGGTITREEAMALERRVTRTCKGPVKAGKEAEYVELRKAVQSRFGHGFGGGNSALDIGLVDTLNRESCGYDFNELLFRFPFDGRSHRQPCPSCGQMISFRSPWYPVDAR